MNLFTQIVLALTNTGMSNADAEALVNNYCMNKMYTPKQEIHYELCENTWNEFTY